MNILAYIFWRLSQFVQIGAASAIILMFVVLIVGSFAIVTMDRNAANEIAVNDAREISFQKICHIYRDASTYDRWFGYQSNVSWCKDYIHRL